MKNEKAILYIAVIGTSASGLISLIIICGVVYLSARDGNVPSVLSNWGGIIIGFFFGQFFQLIQTLLISNNEKEA